MSQTAGQQVVVSQEALNDISKLATGSSRIEVALNALQHSDLKAEEVKDLLALARKYEEKAGSPADYSVAAKSAAPATEVSLIKQAEKILNSLEIGKDGFVKLTIPAGISDIDAMKALNAYFREKLPKFGRAAIWEGDFDWYANQKTVSGRDVSVERKIELNPLVENTTDRTRRSQGDLLKKQEMTFAAPEEVALVVAAYACKNNGKDLLNDLWTRTSASGVALTARLNYGVFVRRYFDGIGYSYVGASGVLSSPN